MDPIDKKFGMRRDLAETGGKEDVIRGLVRPAEDRLSRCDASERRQLRAICSVRARRSGHLLSSTSVQNSLVSSLSVSNAESFVQSALQRQSASKPVSKLASQSDSQSAAGRTRAASRSLIRQDSQRVSTPVSKLANQSDSQSASEPACQTRSRSVVFIPVECSRVLMSSRARANGSRQSTTRGLRVDRQRRRLDNRWLADVRVE